MYYVYLLRSKNDGVWYVGYTNNLRRRLTEHNDGKSFTTKFHMPYELMYYEAFLTEQSAKERELKLKHHGKGLSELKRRILLG